MVYVKFHRYSYCKFNAMRAINAEITRKRYLYKALPSSLTNRPCKVAAILVDRCAIKVAKFRKQSCCLNLDSLDCLIYLILCNQGHPKILLIKVQTGFDISTLKNLLLILYIAGWLYRCRVALRKGTGRLSTGRLSITKNCAKEKEY